MLLFNYVFCNYVKHEKKNIIDKNRKHRNLCNNKTNLCINKKTNISYKKNLRNKFNNNNKIEDIDYFSAQILNGLRFNDIRAFPPCDPGELPTIYNNTKLLACQMYKYGKNNFIYTRLTKKGEQYIREIENDAKTYVNTDYCNSICKNIKQDNNYIEYMCVIASIFITCILLCCGHRHIITL